MDSLKVTELRIGNTVNVDLGSDRISSFWKNDITAIKCCSIDTKAFFCVTIANVFGVELTKKDLLGFGFVKHGISYIKDSVILWEHEGGIVFALYEPRSNESIYLKLLFVHQLQNLYFALTNKELC